MGRKTLHKLAGKSGRGGESNTFLFSLGCGRATVQEKKERTFVERRTKTNIEKLGAMTNPK